MEPKRVLIVDDDSAVQRILVRVFQRAGFEVRMAGNGQQALARLAEGRFDVMVSDIQMPKMNGRELVGHLATTGPYLPDCVFIVTSRSEDEERAWVGEYPGVTLLEKPISPKEVLRLVLRRLNGESEDRRDESERRVA